MSTFAKQLAPFPSVDTNAHFSPNTHFRDPSFNATITASTVFALHLLSAPLTSNSPPAQEEVTKSHPVEGNPPTDSPRSAAGAPLERAMQCMLHITHARTGTGLSSSLQRTLRQACQTSTAAQVAGSRREDAICKLTASRVRIDGFNIWEERPDS